MSITRKQLSDLLKTTKYPVYRDRAANEEDYPYIVYSFINEDDKRASSKVIKHMPLYQISLFTTGTELDFRPIKNVLNDNLVGYSSLDSIRGDENDETVTNFFLNVRCIEDVE